MVQTGEVGGKVGGDSQPPFVDDRGRGCGGADSSSEEINTYRFFVSGSN